MDTKALMNEVIAGDRGERYSLNLVGGHETATSYL